MTFVHLRDEESLGARRDEIVVHVAVPPRLDELERALASVLAHTDPAAGLLLLIGEPERATDIETLGRALLEAGGWKHDLRYASGLPLDSPAATLNRACGLARPADLVFHDGTAVVGEGWLEGLRAPVADEPRVATVSAVGDITGLLAPASLEGATARFAWADGPQAVRPSGADVEAGRAGAPDVPSASRHCVLIRRAALELVGELDPALEVGAALADLAQRALAHGLRNLLAPDALVVPSLPPEASQDEPTLERRYPYRRSWARDLAADGGEPLIQALDVGAPVGRPLSVTIDGRCLTPVMTGTAIAMLELVAGLGARADVQVRVIVLDDCDDHSCRLLEQLGATPRTQMQAEHEGPTDIAHRPYQAGAPEDLILLRRLGRRAILTHLDSIGYRTAAYFGSYREWQEYRELTGAALASADRVVFISAAAAADAQALGLAGMPNAASVIPLATDDPLAAIHPPGRRPAAADSRLDRPYLLCLGTDFMHKNRPFAIRLLDALLDAGTFDGTLVFAGPHVSVGSSAPEEAALLRDRRHLGSRIIDLEGVRESGKRWLLAHAAAVVYPTTVEGFGLIPFEAARAGVPALFAWTSALREHFPAELALLVAWDAEESARRVAPVLTPGKARDRQVQGIVEAGAQMTSAENARRHAELYAHVRTAPTTTAGRVAQHAVELLLERRHLQAELGLARHELHQIYNDPIARGFVGPYAIVPEEIQRMALAVAVRPALRDRMVGVYRRALSARRCGR